MKKINLLWLLNFSMISFYSLSQSLPTFARTYIDTLAWSSIGADVIEINNHYITFSVSGALSIDNQHTMALSVNESGEVYKKSLQLNRGCNSSTIADTKDGNFVVCVGERIISDINRNVLKIFKLNQDFDTLWQYTHNDSSSLTTPYSIRFINNKLHVVGARVLEDSIISNPTKLRGVLLILDSFGDFINYKQFDLDGISHGFGSICKHENGNLLLSGNRYDSLTTGLVMNIDSMGNENWHRWYPELWRADVTALADSNYLLTSWTMNGIGSILSKVDSSGNIIWQYSFSNIGNTWALYKSVELNDQSIASVGLATINSVNSNDGCIQKINAEGNLLWQRYFNHNSGVDFFGNVIETADGGLLINGSAMDPFSAGGQNLWLVKLDSMGCLEPDCWVGVEQADANTLGVAVYPNPATDWLYLKYENTRKITLEIFNLSGQRVLKHQHMAPKEGIEISHLPSGLYLLRFVDELGNVATEKLVVE